MSSTSRRFGEVVLARRLELELSQIEVGLAGGPSNTTLTVIENGRVEKLTRVTARKLDHVLRWEPGSARRVWEGGDPVPLLPGVSREHSPRLRRIIEESDEIDEATRTEVLRIIDTA